MRVLSSPLARALHAARTIAAAAAAEVTVEDRLMDRDYADWAGRYRGTWWPSTAASTMVRGRAPRLGCGAGLITLADQLSHAEIGPVILVRHDIVNSILLASFVPGFGGPEVISQHMACWNRLLHDDRRNAQVSDRCPWLSLSNGDAPGYPCYPHHQGRS